MAHKDILFCWKAENSYVADIGGVTGSSANGIFESFFVEEKKYSPEVIGYILPAGQYWIYPNLIEGKNKATVKITINNE